ncbi:MAG: tetratricopeptide repeat protein [Myxococcales bacterium]|nr:tetratricopeptide repeat protein [Myxococcales bacterium]
MTWVAAIWLGIGCQRSDPELVSQRRAAQAWVAGRDRLEQGDVEGARSSFSEAMRHTDHAVLRAWAAQADAEAGDLQRAIDGMAEALEADPTLASARYNRAAYLVRAGLPEQAAPELRRALAEGAATPLQAFEDPDFAEVKSLRAFDFLPQSALVVSVEPPEPSAFLGSEITVSMTLQGIVRAPVQVRPQVATGPISLVAVTETRRAQTPEARLDLRWTWRVEGAGAVSLGPFDVQAGPYVATAPAVEVLAKAPPGAEAPAGAPLLLPVPSTLAQGVDLPGAASVDDAVVVRAAPHDQITVEPPAQRRTARMEVDLRSRVAPGAPAATTTQWVLHRVVADPPIARVVITAPDGTVRFDGAPGVVNPPPRR